MAEPLLAQFTKATFQTQQKLLLEKCKFLKALHGDDKLVNDFVAMAQTFFSQFHSAKVSDLDIATINSWLPQFNNTFEKLRASKMDALREEISSLKKEINSPDKDEVDQGLNSLKNLRVTLISRQENLPDVITLEQLKNKKEEMKAEISRDTQNLEEQYINLKKTKDETFPKFTPTMNKLNLQINSLNEQLDALKKTDPNFEIMKSKLLEKMSSFEQERGELVKQLAPMNSEIVAAQTSYEKAQASHPKTLELREVEKRIKELQIKIDADPEYLDLEAKKNNLQMLINSVAAPLLRLGQTLKYLDVSMAKLENPDTSTQDILGIIKNLGTMKSLGLAECKKIINESQVSLAPALEKYKDEIAVQEKERQESSALPDSPSRISTSLSQAVVNLVRHGKLPSLDLSLLSKSASAPSSPSASPTSRSFISHAPVSPYSLEIRKASETSQKKSEVVENDSPTLNGRLSLK